MTASQLVALLDLETIEADIFRGQNLPPSRIDWVYGGQVAAQALMAAGRTVEADREVHSLHAYFIRAGDPSVPIVYLVNRIRDGRSFTTRGVTAMQHGRPIFSMSASFQLEQSGLEHGASMPAAASPDSLPPVVGLLPFGVDAVAAPDSESLVWIRTSGRLPDDPLVQACALTFATDLTLLSSVLHKHNLRHSQPGIRVSSLDHAVWFHRRARADEWLLFEHESPSASGARGLAQSKIFAADGRHVATVMQEGMIRISGEAK